MPDSPVADFEELVRKTGAGELFVAVSYTAALELVPRFGRWNWLLTQLLGWVPFLSAIILLPMSVFLRDYWVLGGIPLALLAMIVSTPVNPLRAVATLTALLASFATLALWLADKSTPAVVAASYAMPFWAIRYLYFWNSRKLTRAALQSEVLLLFLLQNHQLTITDTKVRS